MFRARRARETREAKPRKPSPPPLLARTGRFRLVMVLITAGFVGVGVKLWFLHVVNAPKLRAEAEAARRSYRRISADRGHITDVKGALLATSREVWDIGVDPNSFTPAEEHRQDEIAAQVTKIIGVPSATLIEIFNHKVREDVEPGATETDAAETQNEVPAEVDLPAESATAKPKDRRICWAKLLEGATKDQKDAIAALKVKALVSSRRFVRDYPRGRLAAHLVGFVNRAGVPAMGIEKALDFYLKGEDGWIDSRHNAKKQEMADRRLREVMPADGQTVELTLDGVIQGIAEAELDRIGAETTPVSACIIVSEAKTGRLLALANYPTFDLNEFSDPAKAPIENQKNHAVTDVYEPGSVFKIASICAGLQEGLYTPSSTVDCSLNAAPYKGKILGLPKDDHPLGVADLRHIVAKSSNRGTVQIGMRVAEQRGEERLYKYMADFGFGSETGLVTGTESRGILHKPKNWDGQTISRLPMGHAVAVTALQMHYGMSVVAAKGDLYAPMLVNRVLGANGTVVREFEPVVRHRQVVSRKTAETMAELLEGVCSKEGTASKAMIPGYNVAGKTGTTIKNEAGHYLAGKHVASFSGFFPARDPAIVITVIVDEPHIGSTGYGGVVAAPAFRNVAEKLIKWMDLPPSNPTELAAFKEKELKKNGGRAPATSH